MRDLGWENLYLPRGLAFGRSGSAVASADPSPRIGRPADAPPAATASARPDAASATPAGSPRGSGSAAIPAGPAADLFAAEGRPEILGRPVPEEPAERAAELIELGRFTSTCERCRLAETRNRVVFGSGNPDADLMLVGEGPGAEEDRQGLPFVGRAGELLTRILSAIELSRDQVYIANIVKCRPPGNRDPRPDEVTACRGYLERQMELIRPKVIVALGRVAAQTLLGNDLPLGRMRGEWWLFQGVELRVTYHPAALLRAAHLKRPTWEDMQEIRDRLRELAS